MSVANQPNINNMKLTYSIFSMIILMAACQPAADDSAEASETNELFEKNSATVRTYLEGWQNENLDYEAIYANDFVLLGTGFTDPDSIHFAEMKEFNMELFAMYDFELVTDPIMLPGVDEETLEPDGSVRYYGEWKVTKPATDTTEERSGEISLYEFFNFNEEGKVRLQGAYGDFTGLMNHLNSTEGSEPMEATEQ